MRFIYCTGILSVLTVFFCSSFLKTSPAPVDEFKNAPALSLPLLEKKLVIAHCMTNIIRYKGHKFEDSCDPQYYSPTDSTTAALGGLTQVNVLSDHFLAGKTLDEAVEFEMRTALRSGIDGFQFYYTLGNDGWDDIISAYLRVATRKSIGFKFTFCISHPSGGTQESRVAAFAKRMNAILDEAGRDNPHWLRTLDGRLILYTWYGEGLADMPAEANAKAPAYYVANAFEQLAKAVNEKFALVVSINEMISDEKLNSYLDYFPAVWLWTLPYTDNYIGEKLAAACKKRKRSFTGSAFAGFYTSKLLKKGTWDMFHFAADAAKAGKENAERKYIVTGLSYNLRKQLEFAIDKDVPLINIITWNDYPEGHHLAPEVNHNDGFSILLKEYKARWLKQPSPFQQEETIIAFYKKYRHDLRPSPFYYPVIEIEKAGVPAGNEDSLEVVTILDQDAKLFYRDQSKAVGKGLQVTRFAALPGEVKIVLMRHGKTIEALTCPEWITDKPYRTDRLTYSFSNHTLTTYREIFGDALLPVSQEYNSAAPDNVIRFYKPQ